MAHGVSLVPSMVARPGPLPCRCLTRPVGCRAISTSPGHTSGHKPGPRSPHLLSECRPVDSEMVDEGDAAVVGLTLRRLTLLLSWPGSVGPWSVASLSRARPGGGDLIGACAEAPITVVSVRPTATR